MGYTSDYTHGPNGATLRTEIPQAPSYGDTEWDGLIRSLALRNLRGAGPAPAPAPVYRQPDMPMPVQRDSEGDTMARALATARAKDEMEKLREEQQVRAMRMQGPPMMYSYPGGQTVLTQDVAHMNDYQRKMYLPQGSGFENGGRSTDEQTKYATAVAAATKPGATVNLGSSGSSAPVVVYGNGNPAGIAQDEQRRADAEAQRRANAGYGH